VAKFDAEVRPDLMKLMGEAGADGVKTLFLHGW
jgi:hypothetical protein